MPAKPSRKLFVNLAVRDLERSKAFFGKLGFDYDPRFTDENAACMPVGEDAFVMLLSKPFFQTFTKREVCDTSRQTEGLFALTCASRAEVDDLVRQAIAAGGKAAMDPMDQGFMYGSSFYDLDGHHWEAFWMDPKALEKGGPHEAKTSHAKGSGNKLEVTTPSDREIALTRTFDGSRRALFDAWTKPEIVERWLGPRGWSLPVADVDLRVGGAYRFVGRGADGKDMGWGGVFREIVPGERLVATERFDEPWYPGEALVTTAFVEKAGKTTVTTTVRYESKQARDDVLASPMEGGLNESYDRLDEHLAKPSIPRPEGMDASKAKPRSKPARGDDRDSRDRDTEAPAGA